MGAERQVDAIAELRKHAAEIAARGRSVSYLLSEVFVADVQLVQRLIWRARSADPSRIAHALRLSSFSIETFAPEEYLRARKSSLSVSDWISAAVSSALFIVLAYMLVRESLMTEPMVFVGDDHALTALQGLAAVLSVLNGIALLRRFGSKSERAQLGLHVENCARFTEALYEFSLRLGD